MSEPTCCPYHDAGGPAADDCAPFEPEVMDALSQDAEPTIYEQMLEAGVEVDHHESDLYVPANEVTRKILDGAGVKRDAYHASLFWRDGAAWYDVPFAYDPFWARKDGAK